MAKKHAFSPPVGIRVGSAGRLGRGVFATQDFKEGDLIEHAPIIVIDDTLEVLLSECMSLAAYSYAHDDQAICLGLGYTSLYNHSTRPNAMYEVHEECIEVFALRDIKAGTQIKVNYNGDPTDKTKWEFE